MGGTLLNGWHGRHLGDDRCLCSQHQAWTVPAANGPTHLRDGQVCWALAFTTVRGAVLTRDQMAVRT